MSQIVPMNTFPLPGFGGNQLQMPMGFSNPQMQQLPQGNFAGQNFGFSQQQRVPMNMAPTNPQGSMHPRQLGASQTSFQKDVQRQPMPESSSGSLPKFLEGVDEKLISEFKTIIRQKNINYNDKIKEIESKILPQLDSAHRDLYQQFMSESDQTQQQRREVIHQTVGQMSRKAQEEFSKISEILNNPNIGEEERWNKITEMYSNLDSDLRGEFEKKFEPLV